VRLLYLAHRVPYPPDKGDKIRAFHEIRGLAARGHDVHLFTLADDPADLAHAEPLRQWCREVTIERLAPWPARLRMLAALPTSRSLSEANFWSPRLAAAVGRALTTHPPDAIVVYCSSMMQYVPGALWTRTVVDLVDVDSAKWQQYSATASSPLSLVYGLEAARIRRLEEAIVAGAARTLLTTGREVELLGGAHDGRLVALVNGVDLDFYAPDTGPVDVEALPEAERQLFRDIPGDRPRFVFTGAMDYRANVDAVGWFVAGAWPAVRRELPAAEFLVVGRAPAPALRAIDGRDGVRVTGAVADVRPYLRAATACVVPLRVARGIQNKVLEAMACAQPVVVSPAVRACLEAATGDEVVTAADGPDFSRALVDLARNEARRAALGRASRAFVERHHRWETMLERFVGVVEAAGSR
jgi:sugar transferase (PEP-CTERM/EpsH1 system associated)